MILLPPVVKEKKGEETKVADSRSGRKKMKEE